MTEDRIFNRGHLLGILSQVMDSREDSTGRSSYSPGSSAVVQADGHEDVSIWIDYSAISKLSRDLQVVTSVDVSNDVRYLAEIMAYVANFAAKWGPVGSEGSAGKTPFVNKVNFEFCIACVECLATSCGYEISQSIRNDEVSLGFLMSDWPRLAAEFKRILEASDSSDIISSELAPSYDEAFATRELSAESFWNLHSVADQEGWGYEVILMLIEEHLSPKLDPDLVYENNTVSGADWLRLYEWIRRGRR